MQWFQGRSLFVSAGCLSLAVSASTGHDGLDSGTLKFLLARLRQWHLQGWFSRFRAFAVSLPVFWQAQACRLHGRYGPEGQLHWLLQGWYFWLQCTSRCVLFAGLQAHGARQSLFPTSLLYLAVTLLCLVLLWRKGLWIFREMTPGMVSVLNTPLFDSGHIYGVSLRSLLEEFPS